jgi:MFS family permease
MIVQMIGIIAGQALMTVGDPAGYLLFVIPSVLVSLSFTPILLSVAPAPAFDSARPMRLAQLMRASPLGCVGMFLMGGVFSALFGMASVWGMGVGLSVRQISAFIAAVYVGGLVFQYPIGWVSDRYDRRVLILGLAVTGALAMGLAAALQPGFTVLLLLACIAGGIANPLYSLLVAYTNDFLDKTEMAGASAGLLAINGVGAIIGPILTGWLIETVGGGGFFLYIAVQMALLAVYAAWRMTRRRRAEHIGSFAMLSPSASTLAVEAAMEAAQPPGDGSRD